MSTPIYGQNVPEFITDSLAVTQPDFQDNFLSLFNIFSKNHNFTTGNHTYAQLLEQVNPQQTNVNQISIYTKDVSSQTDQLFLRYQGNGQEFQYTNYQIYRLPEQPSISQFFSFLPGGIIVYFGFYASLKNNDLPLQPAVCKNIITYSACRTGKSPDFKRNIRINSNDDGYVTSIHLVSTSAVPSGCFFVMGNT